MFFPFFFFFMLQRCFSGFIKMPLLEALKDSSYTCITCKRLTPRYDNTPGVLLLGDALSTRDPIVASGMSLAFKDVNFWQRALRETEDLGKHGSFLTLFSITCCYQVFRVRFCKIDYSHIVLIIAIWPGDRIRRPEHSTVEHGSCDESV